MIEKPDFITLSTIANSPEGTIEDNSNLYFPFLELDEWVFIIPAASDIDQWHPSIINFEGNTWVLLFTDSTMAHNFAKLNPEEFLSKDGSILYIPLKVKDALHMIYDLHAKGLFGMQINYGLPGFYIPISSMPNVIDYLLRTKTVLSAMELPDLFALSVLPNKPI